MRVVMASLALLWAAAAGAAPRRIAVLELHNPAGLEAPEAAYLTDQVRGAALGLPPDRFLVLTRENVLELLPPGTDLADCVGACEVETGRNLGADFVVTGDVLRFGGELRVALKLHDTKDAKLLAQQEAKARAVADLEAPVRDAARKLLVNLGEPLGGPPERAELFRVTELPPVPDVPEPAPLVAEVKGLKLDTVDIEALEAYDAAVKVDRGDGRPAAKAQVWRELAGKHPAYEAVATARAKAWAEVAEQARVVEEAEKRREAARDADWRKLSRLLKLEVVPVRDKLAWAESFVAAYGPDAGLYLAELAPYLGTRGAERGLQPGARVKLDRAVGALVRLRTPDGDIVGRLNGFDGIKAILLVGTRTVAVTADRIQGGEAFIVAP